MTKHPFWTRICYHITIRGPSNELVTDPETQEHIIQITRVIYNTVSFLKTREFCKTLEF